MIYKCKYFQYYHLPDLMKDVADWIEENEINVCDVTVGTHDGDGDDPSSTIWNITVYHIE
jgi:hypothetical protein